MDGMEELPAAVYVTSPDYLGNTLSIAALADVNLASPLFHVGVPVILKHQGVEAFGGLVDGAVSQLPSQHHFAPLFHFKGAPFPN